MSKRSSLLIHNRQLSNKFSTDVLHLSWVLKYHLYFKLSSWGKAYLIDDQSRGNTKQSGYVYVHQRAEKIVEGIVDEFCLFSSSFKAVNLQLGRGVAK